MEEIDDLDVGEVLVGDEHEVGAARFVQGLVVALLALAARQKEPLLVHVAPSGRFVNQVTCPRDQMPQFLAIQQLLTKCQSFPSQNAPGRPFVGHSTNWLMTLTSWTIVESKESL